MAEGRGYCTFPHFYIIFPFFFVYFISAAFFWDNRDCLPLYDPTSSVDGLHFYPDKNVLSAHFYPDKAETHLFFILSLLVNSYFK